jgi:hypothetical protein
LASSARSDEAWNNFTTEYPAMGTVIDALAYQDSDMDVLYNQGPATTVMFYLSAKIGTSSSRYQSVHRTFPGILKNSTPPYDPPGRSWFKHAPENALNLYGPYRETFTRQFVVTLSSMKKSIALGSSPAQNITIVSAAVMLLSEITAIG